MSRDHKEILSLMGIDPESVSHHRLRALLMKISKGTEGTDRYTETYGETYNEDYTETYTEEPNYPESYDAAYNDEGYNEVYQEEYHDGGDTNP